MSTLKKHIGRDVPIEIAITVIVVVALGINAFAVDQMRTVNTFVGDSDVVVSSQINKQFSIYIGDDISGVSNPVKSVFFTVGGTYTGNGTLQLMLDSNGATAKTFTMPNVSVATPFEVLYKDPSGYISPTTAGTYSYTLNIIPSGVSIYGFSAEVETTYRYAPPACSDGQPTNEKIKSVDHYVGDSDTQISASTNFPFTVYIGDNITGVTSSIKSAYFTMSGTYTGNGGTVQFTIDSNASTSQTFTLPDVGSVPTPFELIYKDPSNYISPTTAGTYTYTLNVIPTSVTISGFGAKLKTTYQYKPPSCSNQYPATGNVTSITFDTSGTSTGPAYNSIMWRGNLGGPSQNVGRVRFQFATATSTAGPWNYVGGATCTGSDWYSTTGPEAPVEITCAPTYHNNQQYFRYQVQICADDCSQTGTYTPTVDDVVVSWSP